MYYNYTGLRVKWLSQMSQLHLTKSQMVHISYIPITMFRDSDKENP